MQLFRVVFLLLSAISLDTLTLTTQAENTWTKTTSGYWEEPFWSLGRLPAEGDTVSFYNEGYKALAVGSVTASNYPAALSMDRLIVQGSNNLLLLNWAGTAVPLRVATDFNLFSGAGLNSHASAIDAATFNNGGRAMFGDTAVANFGTANIGFAGPGELIISNATISSDRMLIGRTGSGTVNQYGGFNRVRSSQPREALVVDIAGFYNLRGGMVEAETMHVEGIASAVPKLTVSGGTLNVRGELGLEDGLLIEGGTVQAGILPLFWGGEVTQTGGKNTAGVISLGSGDNAQGRYLLSGGTLISTNLHAGPSMGSRGYFDQTGGAHTNKSMTVWGYDRTRQHHVSGWYTLGAGLLASEAIYVWGGSFYQGGGSNYVGNLALNYTGSYVLSNGLLQASNIIVTSSSAFYSDFRSVFYQGGGRTRIENELRVDQYSTFRIDGGTLTISNITVHGAFVALAAVTNSGKITLNGGALSLGGPPTHQFGTLGLSLGGGLRLPDAPATVRFKESRSVPWDSGAALVITNWSGSTDGGGADRVIFGSNAQGLSPAQLSQVRFRNPVGFAAGTYPAKILATGEIVPTKPEKIAYTRTLSELRLSWNGNYELWTATNISGPYTRVTGAVNSYTASLADPQRYFQLRPPSP
jgi:hypothetical protein